jgi:hypothetical protein
VEISNTPSDVSTEMLASTPSESGEASTSEAGSTEALGSDPVSVANDIATAPVTAPAMPAAPAYTPNFKFKVKGQEKEIDEMFRSLVTDAEKEKKVKELFEKAEGLASVKEDRETVKRQSEEFRNTVMPHLQVLDQFTVLRDNGNIDAALKVAGITDEQLFEVAIRKLEMEKNPHQAQVYKQHLDTSISGIQMQRQLEHYQHQQSQAEVSQFSADLDNSIARHGDIANQIDQKFGRAGAFKEEVIALGEREFNRGNNLTTDAAAEMVANKYKQFLPTSAPSAPVAAPAQRHVPTTIPNTGNSNVSPVKAKPKSIDDLRTAYKQEVG